MLSFSTNLPWHRRTELRLAAFGLSAIAAVYLGFLAVSVKNAEYFIRHWGYHVMAVSFFLWLAVPLAKPHNAAVRARHPADRRAWCGSVPAFVAFFQPAGLCPRGTPMQNTLRRVCRAVDRRSTCTISAKYPGRWCAATTYWACSRRFRSYLDKRPLFFPLPAFPDSRPDRISSAQRLPVQCRALSLRPGARGVARPDFSGVARGRPRHRFAGIASASFLPKRPPWLGAGTAQFRHDPVFRRSLGGPATIWRTRTRTGSPPFCWRYCSWRKPAMSPPPISARPHWRC